MTARRLAALGAVLLAVAAPVAAQELPFAASDPLRLAPGRFLGEVAGVATNSQGHIFVHHRTGHPYASLGGARAFAHDGSQLLEFDANGRQVREIGRNAYGFLVAQQVRIDPDDNIWAVDAYSGMVLKFSPDGARLLMTLGRKPGEIAVPGGPPRQRPGPPGAGQPQDVFGAPADVAWDAAGNIFVADGVGANARIAKFTPDGVFIRSWGSKGAAPGQFADVHSLAVDAQGQVYAADSGNRRIQVFDNDGTFLRQIGGIGAPAALCLAKGAHPYLYASNSNPVNDIDSGGEIYRLELDGRIVGRFGRAGKRPGEFGTVNAIDCRDPARLLIGEIGNYRVQSIALR